MARKIFISSDIEGTCGITNWDETEHKHADYPRFATQMTREVAAACEGALQGGAEEILVRDSHDTARNINHAELPEAATIFRGWGREPYSMVSGLTGEFSGVMFTGYHSAVGWKGKPLSHTMTTQNSSIKVNGEPMSELMMNSLTAAMEGVPVLMVTGDKMLCDWFHTKVPAALTVAVNEGRGDGVMAMHPDKAVRLIRETAEKAMQLDPAACMFPLPEHFKVEVSFRLHQKARSASWYPGVKQVDSRTVVFECDCWADALAFFHFCL